MNKECCKCSSEMYRDEKGRWFCPDCVLKELDPTFLDENRTDTGELKSPFVLHPPTKPVNLRIAIPDLERAKRLARAKGIPKYQSYLKTLLHEALIKEEEQDYATSRTRTSKRKSK